MTTPPPVLDPDEMFADIERWQALTAQTAPGVEAGSALAEDARRSPDHQVGHAAWYAIGHAVDQMHALKTLVDDARILHPYASHALLRSALENAATAIWLLAPGRQQRLERRLRLAHNEAHEQGRAQAVLPQAFPPELRPTAERVAAIKDLAAELELDYARIATGYFSYEAIVRAAGEASRFGGDYAAFMWRLFSGFAHGRYWAVLGWLPRRHVPSDEEGIQQLSLTADLNELLTTALVPYAMIRHGLALYDQRRQAPY